MKPLPVRKIKDRNFLFNERQIQTNFPDSLEVTLGTFLGVRKNLRPHWKNWMAI